MSYRTSHIETTGTSYDQDLADGGFDSYMSARESSILSRLVNSDMISEHGRYLDFACGTGRITSQVSPHFQYSLAVDVSDKMVEVARSKVENVDFKMCDITQTKNDFGKFDLITAFRFFGNAEDALRLEVLQSLKTHLDDDGVLIFNNHRNPASLRCRLSGETNGMDLTYSKLEDLLSGSGLRIQKSIPVGPWMIRHKWMNKSVWDTHLGRSLDALLTHSGLSSISPDMIIIAGHQE